MTLFNNVSPINKSNLVKLMLWGGVIGLAIISLLVFPIKNPNPAWGKFWTIRPLIVVTFAGITGGACTYFIHHFRSSFGINKFFAVAISMLVCLFGLWMGIVLGLNGTLWN